MTPAAPPSRNPDRLMSRLSEAALDALVQRLPPASGSADAVAIEPAPWVSLTKAQCVLLAIALHRISHAHAGGEKLP
jgi:hypothetical protein